jgi:hypothetical protein
MVRSASGFIIGPRLARTRWRVSNHEGHRRRGNKYNNGRSFIASRGRHF